MVSEQACQKRHIFPTMFLADSPPILTEYFGERFHNIAEFQANAFVRQLFEVVEKHARIKHHHRPGFALRAYVVRWVANGFPCQEVVRPMLKRVYGLLLSRAHVGESKSP